jgi:hypothetical protein
MKQTVHVPFQHAFLFPSDALNLKNIPMTCSNKDVYSEFQFPRKVEENKNSYGMLSNIMNVVRQDLRYNPPL